MPDPTNLTGAEFRAIARRALSRWGLIPDRLELVSNAENCTFRLVMPHGHAYVLRIHRPGYHTLAELESELIWTQALSDSGLHVPVGRRTLDGRDYATIPTPDGKSSRAVGLADWVDGFIMQGEIDRDPDPGRIAARFEQIGRIAARIHNQSSTWTPPPEFVRHSFDAPGFVGVSPFWGRFWEVPAIPPSQRAVLARARDEIESILGGYGKNPDTYSLIHADLHPKNIVVTDTGDLHVIDFDDAGFGWHQYELAVALCELEEEPYFAEITRALIGGYRTVRTLDEEALALLPLFLLIRRLYSIGWVWDRPELGRRQRIPAMAEKACEKVAAFGF